MERKRALRWLLLTGVALICLALAVAALRSRRQRASLPEVSLEPAAIQGFRTTIYRGEQLRLRVAADLLTVSNTKAFGPFSFGFLRNIVAHNVTVDLYPVPEAARDPGPLSSLGELPAVLAGERGAKVSRAELGPIKIVEHRDGGSRIVLTAASCSAGVAAGIVCRDGVLNDAGTDVQFRELSYDGRTVTTVK